MNGIAPEYAPDSVLGRFFPTCLGRMASLYNSTALNSVTLLPFGARWRRPSAVSLTPLLAGLLAACGDARFAFEVSPFAADNVPPVAEPLRLLSVPAPAEDAPLPEVFPPDVSSVALPSDTSFLSSPVASRFASADDESFFFVSDVVAPSHTVFVRPSLQLPVVLPPVFSGSDTSGVAAHAEVSLFTRHSIFKQTDHSRDTAKTDIEGDDAPDVIKASRGGGKITAGRGVDKIELYVAGAAGAAGSVGEVYDTVIYEFDARGSGGWIAYDGADTIDNFERGRDKLELRARLTEGSLGFSFASSADENLVFRVLLDDSGLVYGLGLEFAVSGVSYGAIPSGNTLVVKFARPFEFDDGTNSDFLSLIGGSGNYNSATQKVGSIIFDSDKGDDIAGVNVLASVLSGIHGGVLSFASSILELSVNSPPIGVPRLDGSSHVGEELRVDTSDLDDGDGLGDFSYSWIKFDVSAGEVMVIGDGARYRLSADDLGDFVRVIVEYRDGAGNAESILSAPVRVVLPPPTATERSIYENHPLTKPVYDMSGAGGASDGGGYSLASGVLDNDLFRIDSSGILWVRELLDYETPQDGDDDNVYRLEVSRALAGGRSETKQIDITLKDILLEKPGDGLPPEVKAFSFSPSDIPEDELPSEYARAVLSGQAWQLPYEGPLVLTWSFGTKTIIEERNSPLDSAVTTYISQDDAAIMRPLYERAFAEFEEVANIKFIEVGQNIDQTVRGDISLNVSLFENSSQVGVSGRAFFPVFALRDHIDIRALRFDHPQHNADHFYGTLLHEIGHTLGFKHIYDSKSAWPAIKELSFESIIRSGGGAPKIQPVDIEALQFLYGAPGTNWQSPERFFGYSPVSPYEADLIHPHRRPHIFEVNEGIDVDTVLHKLSISPWAPSDGQPFSLAQGVKDNDLFVIDIDDGEIRFKQSPDFENPRDSFGGGKFSHNNFYELLVHIEFIDTGNGDLTSYNEYIIVEVLDVV